MRVRAHAPGRVNVIGDHTDTTGGFVLPMAIHLGTTVDLEQGGEVVSDRRAGCEGAEERIGPLRDASLADVVALPDDLRPLARHVVSENARVRAFVEALRAGDLAGAGGLMVESHASLRDDFAVSTPRLDALVDRLRATPGVFGARLTGAGFGGCVVALCEPGVDVGGWVLRPSAGARRGFEPDGAR